jgi:hypothetical protein
MERSDQISSSKLGEDVRFLGGGCTGNKFKWACEVVGKLVTAKDEKVLIGALKPFPLDLTFYIQKYSVTFACIDDQLTVLDEDPEHSDLESLKEASLILPAGFVKKDQTSAFNSPFFDQVREKFQVTDVKGTSDKKGTCAVFRLAFNFLVPADLNAQLPRNGGGAFEIPVKGNDYKERIKCAFKVCCCTKEADEGQLAVCDWSSKCLTFDREVIAGKWNEKDSLKLEWQLNGMVGGCGNVREKKDLKGFL